MTMKLYISSSYRDFRVPFYFFLAMQFKRSLLCTVLVASGVLALPARQHVMSLSDTYPPFNGAEDVTFYLYTQSNPVTPEFIELDDDSTSPSFNPKNPTRLAIHGGRTSVESILRFREGYLSSGNEMNVILVDWAGLAAAEEAIGVLSAVQVGDYIGQVLNHLVAARGLDPDDLVLLGHSMGGHVAAIAGNRLGGGLAAEVVALDPASDIFDAFPLENQLDPSDAKFVQVIHTHGGGLGALESRGHADFFPNGGSLQPGCSNNICHHGIVMDFYVESIASRDFVATLCSSYEEYSEGKCSSNEHIPMGEWTPHSVSGSYYLNTNSKSPFALGQTDL